MRPSSARSIAKEDIPSLRFPKAPVNLDPAHHHALLMKVQRAMRLGNGYRGKCRILFRDSEGLKVVETTIWSYDDHAILLKSGIAIPLARVLDVEMP
ncbi:MAG: hypothetical protein H6597_02070 [Flavobacteriales bacterium]|nr:hypothetical protein [Flavobacteriales bacterium]MCB9193292.1 hypothetical protein [Flavobacteriales bacterium]